MISYDRVIPRDFFNEAKLLKCMGWLSLQILDALVPEGVKIEISEPREPFKIQLMEDGHLTVTNYFVVINGISVCMKTVYNSKANFPLICQIGYDEYTVFNENGSWNDEFINRFV